MRKVLLIVLGVIVGLAAVGGIGYSLYTDSQEKKAAAANFVTAAHEKQHTGHLPVTWGTDTGETDHMEIVYTIGGHGKEADCRVELEALRARPGDFWLDEIHTSRTGADLETDVPADVAALVQPDKPTVLKHIQDNPNRYECAKK